MERRIFIKLLSAGVFFAYCETYADENGVKRIRLRRYNIQVPPWLINPDSKELTPKITLDELGIPSKQSYLGFFDEQPVYIDANLTPAQLLKSNNNFTSRTYILLKRTLSFCIYKKTGDIEKYQDQDTIDNMSLNELTKLLTS